ncbi:hypothetical protein RB594_003633 [Gaeumannomyces avenae]
MPRHHNTPKRARIQAVADYLDSHSIPYNKSDLFRREGVSRRSGLEILAEDRTLDARTFHNRPGGTETRGRKPIFSEEDIDKMEATIIENGYDGRSLTWAELPAAAGLDKQASVNTIRKAMQTRQFRSCLSCQRQFLSEKAKAKRVEYARRMLENYGSKENWYHVRFSDETHFGWGPGGRARVLRRPWERDCPDCVQEMNEPPDEKDIKRVHAWAAVGYNFKSGLVWYNVPSNDNGKMTLQVYRDEILEPVVGAWLRDGQDFVLEEDNDSGHGTGKKISSGPGRR